MDTAQIIESSLYFLALINPITKVLFITSRYHAHSRQELISIAIRSSAAALAILAILATIGDFLLLKIFRVEIYSLSVAGGIILFSIGLNAVTKGTFFGYNEKVHDTPSISIIPLAAPLIAGAGTMTAAISFASMYGKIGTVICLTIAITVNCICMLFSFQIDRAVAKINATETMIRITGLIVTAVAMQMILSGCSTWLLKVF